MAEYVWIQILGKEVKGGSEQTIFFFLHFYLFLFSSSCYFSHLSIHHWRLCSRNYPPRTDRFK